MDPARVTAREGPERGRRENGRGPTYSYMGEYYVSEHVMDDIVR